MAGLDARYKPGTNVPAFAKTAVVGGRFVKIVDDKTADGDYQVGHCGLGERAFGVAVADSGPTTQSAHSVERRVNVVRSGAIARVQPSAAITHGDEVQSDAVGKALTLGAATHAVLATGVVGSNNAITWTAKAAGVGGNSRTVTIVDPGGATASLTVDVANNGNDIIVSLARASSAITSTAQQVIDAVQANGEAADLVSVANTSTSSGAGTMAAVSKTNLATGTDPEGSGVALGQAVMDAASNDDFVEVALY